MHKPLFPISAGLLLSQVHNCANLRCTASPSPPRSSENFWLLSCTPCKIQAKYHIVFKNIKHPKRDKKKKNVSLKKEPGKSGLQAVRYLTFFLSQAFKASHTLSLIITAAPIIIGKQDMKQKAELNSKYLRGIKFHAENYALKRYNLGNHT